MRALVNARVALGEHIADGMAVLIEGGRVLERLPLGHLPMDVPREDLHGGLLAPGFVDVQVNGGGGVLFNDDPSVETIRRIGEAHRRYGTTGFLPTLISDDLSVVRAGVAAVDAAIEAGVPGVLGIHIEGPFLNIRRKGIHDPARIRDLDEEGFEAVTGLRHGRTLVTLAPERTTPAMIQQLTDRGVIVAAGHSEAKYDELRAAIAAGMTGCTHLFNAMSPLGSREPGIVGAALDDPSFWCGLIVDGRHVHPATMRLALRAKGAERLFLVTDGMPSVGQVNKSFDLQGHRVVARDGACYNEDGTLAGSDLDMAGAVRNAQAMLGLDLSAALTLAARNPATFIGLDDEIGHLGPGARADLVLLDDAGVVRRTWIGGQES